MHLRKKTQKSNLILGGKMVRFTKSLLCFVAVSLFMAGSLFAQVVTVTNLVGVSTGIYTTVPLPSVIKASSNYAPLFRINVTTAAGNYQITAVTFTITSGGGFQYDTDVNSVAIIKDASNPVSWSSTNTWSGSETALAATTQVIPASGASGIYTVILTLVTPADGDWTGNGQNYTYYIALRTSANITHGDQFNAELDNANEVIVTMSGESYSPTSSNGTVMTADTLAPVLQLAYEINSTSGTTKTVANNDMYNVFTTTDITTIPGTGNNTVSLRVTLAGSDTFANLTNTGVYPLSDLFTFDTTAIDAGLSNTKIVSSNGGSEYRIDYVVTNSTINQQTTPSGIRIKVRDAAGNESAVDDSFYCYMDRTKPSAVTINAPADNAWIGNLAPQLSWQPSTDPNFLSYYLVLSTDTNFTDFISNPGGKGFSQLQSIYTSFNGLSGYSGYIPTTSSGTVYYWGIIAKDKADNYGVHPTAKPFRYDNTVPFVQSNTPTTSIASQRPTVSFIVYDALDGNIMSGIDFSSITFRVDNQQVTYSTQTMNASTTTISYTPSENLADGQYSVAVVIRDNAGKTTNLNWPFNVDSTAPQSLDTDNDGYADADETFRGSNPNSANSVPYPTADFYPLNNAQVSVSSFVTINNQKIKLRINDTGNFSSGLDVEYTTTTLASKVVINHLTNGTTENWYYLPAESYVGTSSATLVLQLARALADNGTDDGHIRVSYNIRDTVLNANSSVLTRDFYFDTTPPVISTVTVAATTDSQTPVTFVVDIVDNFGLSAVQDDIQIFMYNFNTPINMTKGTGNQYYVTIDPSGDSGIYNYYFTAKDAAGNIKVYPPNANSNISYALTLTVSDKTAPKGTISQIKTLLNYVVTGVTATYNTSGTGSLGIKGIPTLYADPASDSSSDFNLIKATVPVEATSVVFEYKLSTAATWVSLTASKTGDADPATSNPIWQAYWNTSVLGTGLYYDLRVSATDGSGNTNTPANNDSAGWAQVYLIPALAPVATIDTTQFYPTNGGFISGPKLLLNANTNTTKNQDVSSVKFQYKKLNDPETAWSDIATDNDATAATKTTLTFYIKEGELPYLSALNGVEVSSITSASLDVGGGSSYDKEMARTGNIWSTTMDFPPSAGYTYSYTLQTPLGTKIFNRDSREYSVSGGQSKFMVGNFAYEWDVTVLTSGESYQARAIAKDSRNNEDLVPNYIAFTYYSGSPLPPVITQPTASQKIKNNTAVSVKASIANTDVYVSTVVFQYSLNNQDWYLISRDSFGANGWNCNWTAPNVAQDTAYYLRAFAWNHPPAISTASAVVTVIVDPTAPTIKTFAIEGTTGTVVLNSGTAYTLKATTLDTDVSTVNFTLAGITGNMTPNTGVIFYRTGGTGTEADPYSYTCTFTPSNKNAASGTITVNMIDSAGNATSKTLNVQVRDITAQTATISRLNTGSGLVAVSDGSQNYIGRAGATIEAFIFDDDGGTVRFQYAAASAGPWTTIGEIAVPTASSSTVWNPLASGIAEGTYYLRALYIDNDNNIDPSPTAVQVKLDYVEPTITSLTPSPAGTIDCANVFSVNVKTADADIKNIIFQYYDITNGWVTIDAATGNRLIMAVNASITPNTVGLSETVYTLVASNITKATVVQIRAVATDSANNSNADATHAPVISVNFDDTTAPVATAYLDPTFVTGVISAETNEANIKSVLFQYKVSDSTQPWITLGTLNAPTQTFSNVGDRWQCATTLAGLPSGTYDIRAIATDSFNNVDTAKAPVVSVLVQINAAGNRVYSMKKSSQLSIGITDVSFGVAGSITLSLEVKSSVALTAAPVASFLITDGAANRITKSVTLSGSGTTYTGSLTIENFAQAGTGNARITVSGQTGSGTVYGEFTSLIMSAPALAPVCTSPDAKARITAWSANLANTVSLLIAPKIAPDVATTQSTLLTSIGRCYEFRLGDGTKIFPAGITATLRLDYSDADIPATIDESTLGIAWWDEVNQKWSSDGITGIIVDRTANTIIATVTHFSAFAIMAVNSTPVITVESPKAGGFADADPLISVKFDDTFSSILAPRIEIDGTDQTALLTNFGMSDGIDNNGNGLIDEKGDVLGGNFNFNANEQVFNTLSNTSARYVVRAPLKLAKGEHILTITGSNAQGRTTTTTLKFNVSDRLMFGAEPHNYPNPFNPRNATTKIVAGLSKEADVTVVIYDFAGNKVAELNKHIYGASGPANEIEWNGFEEGTKKYLADGVYFAAIEAKGNSETIKKFLKIAITSK